MVWSRGRSCLNKIKKLEVDTVYPIAQVARKNDSSRVYLSRLADKGEILKVKRGYIPFSDTNDSQERV